MCIVIHKYENFKHKLKDGLPISKYISIYFNFTKHEKDTYTSTCWRSYYISVICMKKNVNDNNDDNMFTKSNEPWAQDKHSNYIPKKSQIRTRKFSDRNVHFSQWFSATSEAKPRKHHRRSPQACDSLPSWLTQDRSLMKGDCGRFYIKGASMVK